MNAYHLVYICVLLCISACTKGKDEPEPEKARLSISDLSLAEGDEDHTASVPVHILGPSSSTNVIVNYSTLDGSATANSDYRPLVNEQLIFAPGETLKHIEISIIGDKELESNETFEVVLLNPVNAVLEKSRATVTLTNDDQQTTGALNIPSGGYTTPASYAGMDLVWNDEFQGNQLNEENWTHEIGNGTNGWGNNELQYYQPENTFIAEGEYLVIEARRQQVGGYGYTSSRIVTMDKREFQYGRVDIRAALPKGKGIWPALWMLGANFDTVGWPKCGEIDIMEIIGSEPNKLHGTAHWDNNGQHASYGQSTSLNAGTFSDEFHVFSIIWDQNQIRWLLDDVQYNVIDITPAGLSEFRAPFFFIFNVAVGGNWPGSPDGSTQFPQHLIVDYIRVFQ